MSTTYNLNAIPDDELLHRLVELLRQSRRAEADLVAHVGEADARRLYAREASPSMFAYCTERLHLSEAEAYLRIAAARASREHPMLLTMLADGRLHLTAIAKLAPHLTPENREELLARATHKTKRQIQELVAELLPRPDVPALIRKTPPPPALRPAADRAIPPALELRPGGVASPSPEPGPDGVATGTPQLRPDAVAVPAPPSTVEPLAPCRYRVQFTASTALRDKLQRLQDLMRSSVPDGDLAAIIEAAVTEKLERLEARRFARTPTPRKSLSATDTSAKTRQIPAAVRRAVYERDGGRCRFVDGQGRRCNARDDLQYHHRRPFGYGGDHSPSNLVLLCACHNLAMAEADYGREAMARHRRSRAAPPSLGLHT